MRKAEEINRPRMQTISRNVKLAIFAILVCMNPSFLGGRSYAQQRERRSNIPPELKFKIDATVKKAAAYLKEKIGSEIQTGFSSLGAYALMTANEFLERSVIIDSACQKVLDHIEKKFNTGGDYEPKMGAPVYEASVDLLALSKAQKIKKKYKHRIQAIVSFLQKDQDQSGFWSYPVGRRDQGDTSQSQYAILGLWAAEVLGEARVPASVWQKVLQWHLKTQNPTGGFAYHPGNKSEGTTLTMTAAGLGSLYICRQVMSGKINAETKKKVKRSKKFSDLKEAITGKTDKELAEEKKQKQGPGGRATIAFDAGAVNSAIAKAQAWLGSNFKLWDAGYPLYYLYSIERIGYFTEDHMFGKDWYVEGANILIAKQRDEGFWSSSGVNPYGTASYGILFLTRATKVFGPRRGLDGGDLRGNTGGITFSEVTGVRDGKPVILKKQIDLAKDIKRLEQIEDLDFSELLIRQIVKEVEFDPSKKKELLENVALMRKLLGHKKWKLRQVAVWALGKTGKIDDVPRLITALKDESPDVMREAHLALCYISRKPLGPKDKYGKFLPIGPFENLSKDVTDVQKEKIALQWSSDADERWTAWYFRIRPYEQRDDLKDAGKKNRAKAKKSQFRPS